MTKLRDGIKAENFTATKIKPKFPKLKNCPHCGAKKYFVRHSTMSIWDKPVELYDFSTCCGSQTPIISNKTYPRIKAYIFNDLQSLATLRNTRV